MPSYPAFTNQAVLRQLTAGPVQTEGTDRITTISTGKEKYINIYK